MLTKKKDIQEIHIIELKNKKIRRKTKPQEEVLTQKRLRKEFLEKKVGIVYTHNADHLTLHKHVEIR